MLWSAGAHVLDEVKPSAVMYYNNAYTFLTDYVKRYTDWLQVETEITRAT